MDAILNLSIQGKCILDIHFTVKLDIYTKYISCAYTGLFRKQSF